MKVQLRSDKILMEMAKTFRQRNKLYGNNYDAVGDIMVALFPDGLTLKTKTDFIKFHLFDWNVGKISRFGRSMMTHVDSIHDASVYGSMIEDLVRQTQKGEKDGKQTGNSISIREQLEKAFGKTISGPKKDISDRSRKRRVNR